MRLTNLFCLLLFSAFAKTYAIDRCSNNALRSWWNVEHYDLDIYFDLVHKSLSGTIIISANAVSTADTFLQLDLASQLSVEDVYMQYKTVAWQPIENGFIFSK